MKSKKQINYLLASLLFLPVIAESNAKQSQQNDQTYQPDFEKYKK